MWALELRYKVTFVQRKNPQVSLSELDLTWHKSMIQFTYRSYQKQLHEIYFHVNRLLIYHHHQICQFR